MSQRQHILLQPAYLKHRSNVWNNYEQDINKSFEVLQREPDVVTHGEFRGSNPLEVKS